MTDTRLTAVLDYIRQHPGATYREIVAGCGLSSTSVAAFHVQRLAARGLVSLGMPGAARQIRATGEDPLRAAVRRAVGEGRDFVAVGELAKYL